MMSRTKLSVLMLAALFAASTAAMAQDWTEVELLTTKDSNMIEPFGGGTNKGHGGLFYMDYDEGIGTLLLQWDLSGVVVPAGKEIRGAEIELTSGAQGPYRWQWYVTAYPMREPWQEGVGVPTDGYGGIGWPWGPTSVGDATWNWSSVSTVGPGASPFDGQTVGLTGTPWEAPGGLGQASDCYPRLMCDFYTEGPQEAHPAGESFGRMSLKDEGLNVVGEWIAASLDNNGLVMTCENADEPNYSNWRAASRENATAGNPANAPGPYAPRLWIHIGPPAPAYLGGDADLDGCVDGADYTAWADFYSTTESRATWRMGGWTVGNWTDDNLTDGADYTAWADNYGTGCPTPEPATLMLLALGAVGFVLRRKR